ncbi:hypothetical protein EJB05_02757, partial [Eragrostis curvula]
MDHQYLGAYPPSAPSTPGDLETDRQASLYLMYPTLPPPLPPAHGLPLNHHQQQPQQQLNNNRGVGWAGNDPGILLVVATLITALTFMLGTTMPGGYWPQDTLTRDGTRVMFRAGDPVMRDLHRPRYWVFRGASWAGVASSMVMTVSLLVRMPVESRHVRYSFIGAYTSLLLAFAASQTKTHLSLDIIACLAVLACLGFIICNREENRAGVMRVLCCGGGGN